MTITQSILICGTCDHRLTTKHDYALTIHDAIDFLQGITIEASKSFLVVIGDDVEILDRQISLLTQRRDELTLRKTHDS